MKVAFVGLGTFGLPIARRLLSQGAEIGVLSLNGRGTAGMAAALESGATLITQSMISAHDVLVFCLPKQSDIAICLATLEGSLPSLVIDLSTISPSESRINALTCMRAGTTYIDAPVSGSLDTIRTGNLVVFCGVTQGASATFDAFVSMISTYPVYLNEVGKGSAGKLANQLTHLCNMAILRELVLFIEKQGLPVDVMLSALARSSAGSAMLSRFGPAIASQDTTPLFRLGLALKDLSLVTQETDDTVLDFPLLRQSHTYYRETCDVFGPNVNFSVVAHAPKPSPAD